MAAIIDGVLHDLPSGTVTFLFTDVEGSTKLPHALGVDACGQALTEHRRILRRAFTTHGGVEVEALVLQGSELPLEETADAARA